MAIQQQNPQPSPQNGQSGQEMFTQLQMLKQSGVKGPEAMQAIFSQLGNTNQGDLSSIMALASQAKAEKATPAIQAPSIPIFDPEVQRAIILACNSINGACQAIQHHFNLLNAGFVPARAFSEPPPGGNGPQRVSQPTFTTRPANHRNYVPNDPEEIQEEN